MLETVIADMTAALDVLVQATIGDFLAFLSEWIGQLIDALLGITSA
jgi:hypothetical protein